MVDITGRTDKLLALDVLALQALSHGESVLPDKIAKLGKRKTGSCVSSRVNVCLITLSNNDSGALLSS